MFHVLTVIKKEAMRLRTLCLILAASLLCTLLLVGVAAKAQRPATPTPPAPGGGGMTITQTLSDGAQRNTIAFDALAFLTGNLGADSFFPPGKVADFWGFQFLRDNDPTAMGHNTDFLTRAALNMLHVLTSAQRSRLIALAQSQVDAIRQYAEDRFVLMAAFRRLLAGDLPAGCTGLNQAAVEAYSAELYRLDGEISYQRAQVMGTMISGFAADQRAYLDAMVGKGMLNWPDVQEPDELRGLGREVKVAVMTYVGDMFSWYVGSLEADVYFCPERQGTYFGSFYMKDAPAVGNPGYSIPVTMTAEMGEAFLRVLTPDQASTIAALVDDQKPALYSIVERRRDVAALLRQFMAGGAPAEAAVLSLMQHYGELDGDIVYRYATAFAQVNQGLTGAQRTALNALRLRILGDLAFPTGAYLYAEPISMPTIPSTDFLFAGAATPTTTPAISATPTLSTATPPNTPRATPTQAQQGGIDSLQPTHAVQGQRDVVVSITLSAASAPPSEVIPRSVEIGNLRGRNVERAGLLIRATFDFPRNEPVGSRDVVATFPSPNGALAFTRTGGFEVRTRDPDPGATPPRRVNLPLLTK